MESLLANYAYSDEEEEQIEEKDNESQPKSWISKPSSPIFNNLPPPKSKPSLLSSLPPPKTSSSSSSSSSLFSSLPIPSSNPPIRSSYSPSQNLQIDGNQPAQSKQTKPIFSSIPQPKSHPSSNSNRKRVVQFTLPLNPSLLRSNNLDDDDEDDELEEGRKPIKDSSNSSSLNALSSMLPAPKNTLCLVPSANSRRAAFDSNAPSSNQESTNFDQYGGSSKVEEKEGGDFDHHGSSNVMVLERNDFASYPSEEGVGSYENYGSYDGNWAANNEPLDSTFYETCYESGGGGDYGSYNNVGNWSDGNVAMAVQPVAPEMERIVGRKRRNEIPAEIVEVNQAELMKNAPREDQVKVTGIAFGPAYQPVSTGKGKPSKLHKRKHQIGSLYFDMKQKEMELAERRSKGFLTKAETQAKYGW